MQIFPSPQEPHEPASKRLICFICVNYYSASLIAELLNSIEKEQDRNIHCIIIDNSPYDTGLSKLAAEYQFTLLQPGRNLGFGGGCNLGLDYVETKHSGALVWLINPDARLIPGAIAKARRCLQQHPNLGLLGTRIEDRHGVAWFNHGIFDPTWGKLLQTNTQSNGSALNRHCADAAQHAAEAIESECCDWLSGCSLIMDLQHLPAGTRFDTTIFLYYEDAELCLRLRKQGIQPHVTKAVLASHLISATMKRHPISRYKHATFGKLYLLHQHGSPLAVVTNLAWFAILAFAMLLKESQQAIGRIAGVAAYLIWLIHRRPQKPISQACLTNNAIVNT